MNIVPGICSLGRKAYYMFIDNKTLLFYNNYGSGISINEMDIYVIETRIRSPDHENRLLWI